MTAEEYYDMSEQFYSTANTLMTSILENLDHILILSQAVLILLCGICIYHLFWGRK